MVTLRHTFILGRDQRVDVRDANGELRMIADHPLNSPLIGINGGTRLVRAAEFDVGLGDRTLVVYAARAGKETRAASAVVMRRADGALSITCWQVEAGFAHQAETIGGHKRHRIVGASAVNLAKPADAPAGAPMPASVFRKELR